MEQPTKLTSLNEYRLLGRSGLRVSPLCLGCMTFGDEWSLGSNKDESKKVFDLYRSKGGNFYDTANVYQGGTSERYLGEFLSSFRSEAVIATKYTLNLYASKIFSQKANPNDLVNPNAGGNHRKSLVENIDESLKRLGTGYVDILYVHCWEFRTPVVEVVRALDDCVRSGKALYLAISDTPAYVISEANTLASFHGWTPFIGLQTRYNLLDRSFEGDLKHMCQEQGLGVIPWGALAEGFLTGKHKKAEISQDSGRKESVGKHFDDAKNLEILDEVIKIADEVKRTPAQVSLNWLASKGTIPLIGAKTVAQLEDNLGSIDFKLSDSHIERLDKVSAPVHQFPYSFLANASIFVEAGLKVEKRKY